MTPVGTIQNANRTGAKPSGRVVRVVVSRTANTSAREIAAAHHSRRRQIITAA